MGETSRGNKRKASEMQIEQTIITNSSKKAVKAKAHRTRMMAQHQRRSSKHVLAIELDPHARNSPEPSGGSDFTPDSR